MLSRLSLALVVVGLFVTASCKITPFGPGTCTNSPATLSVQPSLDTILVGGNGTFLASGRDIFGFPPCSFTWTSSDVQVVSVPHVSSAQVTVAGRSAGSATVVVSSGGMTAHADVVVRVP